MNPYRAIAKEHLSIEELEQIIAEKREEQGQIKAMSDRDKQINEYRKYFRNLKPVIFEK